MFTCFLITRAYDHENAARYLLVKGNQDHVASGEGVHAVIDSPVDEALEAAILAARINRLAGHYACPTPASQVMEMIAYIPRAMEDVLESRDKPHEPGRL